MHREHATQKGYRADGPTSDEQRAETKGTDVGYEAAW